ncbi:MAG TPA: hypothetical protein PLU96_07360 [Methanofastidiosum sp.]|jgi:hypothetical protein|nr:hypothetical protein [Methanofastidiosum sp.]
MVLAIASISAQYPTVVTGGVGPSPLPPGPTPTKGNNYSFIIDTPLGTFQSVQVLIDGIAYDLTYENGAWRGEFPAKSGQTYFYRITTRAGVSFESTPRRL